MNKVVNGQVIDITGTPEEAAILAEWADNTPGTGAKWIADQLTALLALRAQAKAVFADSNGGIQAQAKAMRGQTLATLDEFNVVREWIAAFKVEVAAAVSLADLKARVAGLPAMPDRTIAQIKTAIRDKIDAGVTDS
jgi:hypothetical protein